MEVISYCLRTARHTLSSKDASRFESITKIIENGVNDLQFESPFHELLKTGCYFPGLTLKSKVAHIDIQSNKDDSDPCTKDYKHAGRLGAGVVLFWCVEHRECLGFQVLESAESCEGIYNTLSTRFETMPEIFIYDNACNLFEVRIGTYRSIALTAIQLDLLIPPYYVMEFISKVTKIVQGHLIAFPILQCKACLLSFMNRRTRSSIN